eukprot:3170803-Prymnesium_polylepis.2
MAARRRRERTVASRAPRGWPSGDSRRQRRGWARNRRRSRPTAEPAVYRARPRGGRLLREGGTRGGVIGAGTRGSPGCANGACCPQHMPPPCASMRRFHQTAVPTAAVGSEPCNRLCRITRSAAPRVCTPEAAACNRSERVWRGVGREENVRREERAEVLRRRGRVRSAGRAEPHERRGRSLSHARYRFCRSPSGYMKSADMS